MSLLVTLLAGAGGGGGGSGSVSGVILSPVVAATTQNHASTYANGTAGIGATLTNGSVYLTAARVATTGALTAAYANGALGVGATLTNSGAQAAISIDGVTLSLNDRVLVKNQATAAQNGVYSVTTVGTGSTNWVLTRVTDFDQAAEMTAGTEINITAGTTNTGTLWILSTTVGIVGTDAVTFAATAAITIDGQSPTIGQRVLIKNQTSALQNGVYIVTTVGSATANWVLTRTTDFNSPSQMVAGTLIEVINGTVNAGTVWELTTTVAAVGTNSVSFISINISTKVDQNGSPIFGTDSVGTDSYAITLSPAPSSYTTGMIINFVAGTANTGAATLNVNSLGAKTIKKQFNLDLSDNDIVAGQLVTVAYDGTNFQLLSQRATTYIQQSGASIYAADSVGTDSYAVTLSPVPAAYVTGMVVNFKAGTANTGACSLNVNNLGAITIKKLGGSADTVTGDIVVGQICTVVYDGTNFQLQSEIAQVPAAVLPAGTILQVVQGTLLTTASSSSSTPADTGITATITPASTSNKILIIASVNCGVDVGSNNEVFLTLTGGNSNTFIGGAGTGQTRVASAAVVPSATQVQTSSIVYLDSPATVSAITYKVQFAAASNAATVYINRSVTDTGAANFPRAASSIILLEVKG